MPLVEQTAQNPVFPVQKAVQRALLGSTYGWDSWERLLHRRFLRHGAYFIKHGEFDWTTDIGDRYVPEREAGEDPAAWHPDDELFVPLYGSADELEQTRI